MNEIWQYLTKPLLCLLAGAVLFACRPASTRDDSCEDDIVPVVPSEYADIHNQGQTEACWIYAMIACIEQESLRRGDSVVLSRQWVMARCMEEQAVERYLLKGEERARISMRGVGPEALRLIRRYGLVPYQMEKSRINDSGILERKLTLLADNRALTVEELRKRVERLLPEFTVSKGRPEFFLYSMRYTPQQFAESIMYAQHWEWYASSGNHPWHEVFALEVPDNRRYHEYTNLPPQEMLDSVISSLHAGHPVYWELSNEPRTGASDHALAILGIEGDSCFVCLNSYGKDWGDNGCCRIPVAAFKDLTSNVGIITDTPKRPH